MAEYPADYGINEDMTEEESMDIYENKLTSDERDDLDEIVNAQMATELANRKTASVETMNTVSNLEAKPGHEFIDGVYLYQRLTKIRDRLIQYTDNARIAHRKAKKENRSNKQFVAQKKSTYDGLKKSS